MHLPKSQEQIIMAKRKHEQNRFFSQVLGNLPCVERFDWSLFLLDFGRLTVHIKITDVDDSFECRDRDEAPGIDGILRETLLLPGGFYLFATMIGW